MKLKFFVLLCIISTFAYSQKIVPFESYLIDNTDQPPEMVIDVEHIIANFKEFKPAENYVKGSTTMIFKVLKKNLDSIYFVCPKVKILNVKLNDKNIKFRSDDGGVWVFPQKLEWLKKYTIYFEHEANPFIYPNFAGWKSTKNTKQKQIWGFHMINAMPWIGHKHDLVTTETIITFDKNFKALSNGERVSVKDNKDGTLTWHYKLDKPYGYYIQSLIIGDYEYKTFKTNKGLPLEYWYYRGEEKKFEPTYRYSLEMFDFLENEFGVKYPWNIYRNVPVVDCPFGGMETTTGTIFNEMMFVDERAFLDRSYVNTNVHELIHQWFGNYVSYANDENIWTSESFATYFSKKFEQYIFGEDQYQNIRLNEYRATMNAADKDDYPVAHALGAPPRWYQKGSLVLDMLRYVMGEDEFKHFIAYFLKKHQYAIIEGNDYLVAIRESTGQTLDWFFKQWIYKGGEPHYKVSYKEIKNTNNQKVTQIFVEQIHQTNHIISTFKMPIVFEVYYKDGTKDSLKTWIEKKQEVVEIPNPQNKEIDFVLFDPNRNVLKKLTFNRSFEELKSQALKAKNMIDRYDAIVELQNTDIEKKRQLFIEVFNKEKFWLIKDEIIKQLKDDTHNETIKLFIQAINDKNVKVRQAVAKHVAKIPAELKNEYFKLLKDSSYRTIEFAMTNLYENFPSDRDKILEITKDEIGWWGLNIRIKWLELAYENTNKQEYLEKLVEYSNIDDYEIMTVMNAIASLQRLNYLNETVADNLFKAYLYWSDRAKTTAQNALKMFYQQNKYRRIIDKQLMKLSKEDSQKIKNILQ